MMDTNDKDALLKLLKTNVEEWNSWRKENRDIYSIDLTGADLSGTQLKGANLHSVKFQTADLRRTNLESSNLCGTNFQGAKLQEANLRKAKITEGNLRNANLEYADLSETKITRVNLNEARMRGANLKKAELYRVILDYVDLSDANLQGAKFKDSTAFNGVNLSGADLRGARLMSANLRNATLQGTVFSSRNSLESQLVLINEDDLINCRFIAYQDTDDKDALLKLLKNNVGEWNKWRIDNPDIRIGLSKADLSGANLSKADLRGADLSEADLRGADLSEANLSKVNLRKTNLELANLGGANLESADLYKADLSRVDLRVSKLTKADLARTDLRVSKLTKADLSGADLSEADLGGAILTEANLCRARLSGTNLIRTTLTRAILNGACIENANIVASTDFTDVTCDFIFQSYDRKNHEFTNRLPRDLEQNFDPGEFEARMTILSNADDIIEITLQNGIEREALFASINELRRNNPEEEFNISGIQGANDTVLIRLHVSTEKEGKEKEEKFAVLETDWKESYFDAQGKLDCAQREILCLENERTWLRNVVGGRMIEPKVIISGGQVGTVGESHGNTNMDQSNQANTDIQEIIQFFSTAYQGDDRDVKYRLKDIAEMLQRDNITEADKHRIQPLLVEIFHKDPNFGESMRSFLSSVSLKVTGSLIYGWLPAIDTVVAAIR